MKTKLSLLLVLLIIIVSKVNAKFVQEIELNDGTILVGYVYRQQPGKFIVFYSTHSRKDPKSKYTVRDRNYTLQWNDVKVIRMGTESDMSWCYDKLTLQSGTIYVGRIEEQELGVSMTIRLKDNGKKVTVKYNALRKLEKIPVDSDKDIWLNRQYTNGLKLRDDSFHEGLIIMQYWADQRTDSYVELLHATGYRERIYIPDIKEFFIRLE